MIIKYVRRDKPTSLIIYDVYIDDRVCDLCATPLVNANRNENNGLRHGIQFNIGTHINMLCIIIIIIVAVIV